jgi:hypothetical protein
VLGLSLLLRHIISLELAAKDNQTIQHISPCVDEILAKIGAGVVETISILDLRRVAPMDGFVETRSTQEGTDIIGKVNENAIISGIVSTSVNYAHMNAQEERVAIKSI